MCTHVHTQAHVHTFHKSKRPFELELDMKHFSEVQNSTIQNTRIAQMYNTEIVQIQCKLNDCKKLIKEC